MSVAVNLADYPVLIIMFGMDGCPACSEWLPRFHAAAQRHPRVPAFAVESNAQSDAADRFGVRETPTTFLLQEGRIVMRFKGAGSTADAEKLFHHGEELVQRQDGTYTGLEGNMMWRR